MSDDMDGWNDRDKNYIKILLYFIKKTNIKNMRIGWLLHNAFMVKFGFVFLTSSANKTWLLKSLSQWYVYNY